VQKEAAEMITSIMAVNHITYFLCCLQASAALPTIPTTKSKQAKSLLGRWESSVCLSRAAPVHEIHIHQVSAVFLVACSRAGGRPKVVYDSQHSTAVDKKHLVCPRNGDTALLKNLCPDDYIPAS